jgi:hypothetical protein
LQGAEHVGAHVNGRSGLIRRPDLIGAILVKLGAIGLPGDPRRHFQDLASC